MSAAIMSAAIVVPAILSGHLVNRLPFSVKVTRKAGLYTVKIPKKVLKAPLQYCNQGPQFLAFWQNLAETLLKVKKTYLSVDRMTATRLFYY